MRTDGKIHNRDFCTKLILDHSKWVLPRRIFPSDIDMIFDNSGKKILFCELKSYPCTWDKLSIGQRRLCESLVRLGNENTQTYVALAYHRIPKDRDVDTANDIISFQVAYLKDNQIQITPNLPGKGWVKFVESIIYDVEME